MHIVRACAAVVALCLACGVMSATPQAALARVEGSDLAVGATANWDNYAITVDSATYADGQLTVLVTMMTHDSTAIFAYRYLDAYEPDGHHAAVLYGPTDTTVDRNSSQQFQIVYDDPDQRISVLTWDNWSNEESWVLDASAASGLMTADHSTAAKETEEGQTKGGDEAAASSSSSDACEVATRSSEAASSAASSASSSAKTPADLFQPTQTKVAGVLTDYSLNLGSSSSQFFILPDGKTMLVNAGEQWCSDAIVGFVQSLGFTRIDYLVITSPQTTFIGGAAGVIAAMDVGDVWVNPAFETSSTPYLVDQDVLIAFKSACSEKKVPIKTMLAGDRVYEANGCTVDVYAPMQYWEDQADTWPNALLVTFGETRTLVTGGASVGTLRNLGLTHVDVIDAEQPVLKSFDAVADQLSPTYAVVQMGADQAGETSYDDFTASFGGATVWRSYLDGVVAVTSDGTTIQIVGESGASTPMGADGAVGEGIVTGESPATEPTPAPAQPATDAAENAATQMGAGSMTITAESDPAFAAILALPEYTDTAIASFATSHKGQTIEFDGNIQALSHHGSYKTRYDYLIGPGDFDPNSAHGPAFWIEDASLFDMNWVGSMPDSVGVGVNVHVVAKVVGYDEASGLFEIEPVQMSVR